MPVSSVDAIWFQNNPGFAVLMRVVSTRNKTHPLPVCLPFAVIWKNDKVTAATITKKLEKT